MIDPLVYLQEWGFHVWNETESPEFDLALVERVSPKDIEHLDRNFFRVRFDRLTPLQRKYLRAMAELGAGPHRTGDIAEALGVTPQQIAPTRRALVDKSVVWSQRMGETAFTAPLFDEFVRRRMPELERHVPTRRRS